MKVLFLGDIVGKKGREVIRDLLPSLKKDYKIDFVIANGENAAHGKGITYKLYNQLLEYGIDCITLGNHAFSKKEIIDYLNQADKLICPINHINQLGKGYRIFKIKDKKICVINCLGTFMFEDYALDPYKEMDKMFKKTRKENVDYYIVDFHGEATAEKRVFVEYYKNKLSAVIGTHTHVQTADEQIIGSTAFISDVGMCGPFDSIIGRDSEECIKKMVKKEKTKYTISLNPAILCGLYIEFSDNNKKAIDIKRIQIRPSIK